MIFKLIGDVRANSRATLLPMPDEAPVTTMVFPSRRLPIAEAMLRWKVVLITFAIGVVLLLLLRRRADENEENVRKEVEQGSMRKYLSMPKRYGNWADQDFSVSTINDGIGRMQALKVKCPYNRCSPSSPNCLHGKTFKRHMDAQILERPFTIRSPSFTPMMLETVVVSVEDHVFEGRSSTCLPG